MLEIVFRTIIIYFALLIFMRIMGKREIGQLSLFDFVVSIVIAELAAIPMERENSHNKWTSTYCHTGHFANNSFFMFKKQ